MQNNETEYAKVPARDAAIEQYIADNGFENVQGSPKGFYYLIETEGNGAIAKPGDWVAVHYVGTRLDGVKFDSSRDRDEPFSFQIGQGQVISGWDNGIPLFSTGSRGKLFLPPSAAYGASGAGPKIGPNTPLVFDIEVLDVMNNDEMLRLQNEEEEKYREILMRQLEVDRGTIADYARTNGLLLRYTEWGVGFAISKPGTGPNITPGQTALVHYTGRLLNGQKFDSSLDRGQPISVPVGAGRVIPGWEDGLLQFAAGAEGRLYIPSVLAYGPEGAGGVIPPNANLIFDIQIVAIQ
jgi:peptidylprolyl isomerase